MRSRLWILIALIPILLIVLVWARVGNPLSPFDDRSFTAGDWAKGAHSLNGRAPMARSAIRRIDRGMNEAEVVELLGRADKVITDRYDAGGNRLRGARTYSYDIGSGVGGLDSAWLYVFFDDGGKVIGAEINGY